MAAFAAGAPMIRDSLAMGPRRIAGVPRPSRGEPPARVPGEELLRVAPRTGATDESGYSGRTLHQGRLFMARGWMFAWIVGVSMGLGLLTMSSVARADDVPAATAAAVEPGLPPA